MTIEATTTEPTMTTTPAPTVPLNEVQVLRDLRLVSKRG